MNDPDVPLSPEKMIDVLADYGSFVASLHNCSATVLRSAMDNGRWSVCDAVSHIMKWDEHFVRMTLKRIVNGEPAVLAEHVDVQSFNNRAVEYGRSLPPDELLEQAAQHRADLVSLLRRVPAAGFSKSFSTQSSHTLSAFLHDMFVSHDAHHRSRMEWHIVNQPGVL